MTTQTTASTPTNGKPALRRESLRTLTSAELRLAAGGIVIRTRRCAC